MPKVISKLISQSKVCIAKFHVSPICVLHSLLYKTSFPSNAFLPPSFVGLQVVAKNEVMFKGVNLKFLEPDFIEVEIKLTDRHALLCIHAII
jgi:hypothetical protein